MHIITGKYKHQKVKLTKSLPFQPISTAIRESIFAVLNNYLPWNKVVAADLFAGSGILGLEALSWGSQFCFLNDISQTCCQMIQQNLSHFQIKNGQVSCLHHKQFLLQLKVNKHKLDLVFIDPPYNQVNLVFESLNLLLTKKLLNPQAVIVIRTNQALSWNQSSHLPILTSKRYGKHYLVFLQFILKPQPKLFLKQTKLLIISGPSGVGKKKIIQSLLTEKSLNLAYSISATTRPPRFNEQNKVDYLFLSTISFKEAIANNQFVEYAQYLDEYYGTLKSSIQKLIEEKKNILFETEIEGALAIKKQFPQAFWIFLFPPFPYEQELRKRIQKRATETETEIEKRIAKAKTEMEKVKKGNLADYYLVNDCQKTTGKTIIHHLQKWWFKQ